MSERSAAVPVVQPPSAGKRDLMQMMREVQVPESELIQPTAIVIDDGHEQELFAEIQRLRDVLQDITKHGEQVQKAYLEQRMAFTPEATNRAKDLISDLTSQMIIKCRSFMQDLTLLKSKSMPDPVLLRVRNEQTAVLSKKFQQVYQDFKDMADTSQQKYATAISGISEMDVQDIQDRHQEILKLERQLQELNAMFLDMAVMVDSQTSTITHVESNTEQSHKSVVKSQTALRQAQEYQKSSRSKRLCIGFWTLFIVGIIVIVVLLV